MQLRRLLVIALSELPYEELETLLEQVKAEDDALLRELFGEADSSRYKRLQRRANTSLDVQRADAAYAEVEEMEARLTEAEQNRLFGIGEQNVIDIEDVRAALRLAQDRLFEAQTRPTTP